MMPAPRPCSNNGDVSLSVEDEPRSSGDTEEFPRSSEEFPEFRGHHTQLLTRGCGRESAGPARVVLASLSRRRFHGGFHAYLLLLIGGDHTPIAPAQQNR